METVVRPPADPELHLLTDWGDPDERSRRRKAAIATLALHVVGIAALAVMPRGMITPPQLREAQIVTPLVEPLTQLTQKAPNKGKVSSEFDAIEMEARAARVRAPQGAPAVPRPQPKPLVLPPGAMARATPPPVLPEAPKMETLAPPPPPPPQIQVQEKPKLAFETPASPPPVRPQAPSSTVSNAIRGIIREGGAGGAGLSVGDPWVTGLGGSGEGVNMPPAPGSPGSKLQLLSDPLGVDFRPYLTRILASVRQHWMAVIPESVKLGRRGKVAIQFSIGRDGNVPKLVIATPSGADALDRAAVAGISASVPFPPLPSEYKGEIIKLQFNFAYNMPRQ